jgi:hypothetical protein
MATNPTPQDIPDDQPEPPKPVPKPVPKPPAKKKDTPPVGQRVPGTNTYDVGEPTVDTKKYAKGGSVRGGGCEIRGKTKGRFV